MSKQKLTDSQLLKYINNGLGVKEIARKKGMSASAVSQRLRKLKMATTRDVQTRTAPKIVNNQIDAFGQINKINSHANELLDTIMAWIRGDKKALQVLEQQVRLIKVGQGDEEEYREVKIEDPRKLALRCMGEIRAQLDLQLKLLQSLYDMKAVAEFQEEVTKIIGEVDPTLRDELVRRLQDRRAIRSTLQHP